MWGMSWVNFTMDLATVPKDTVKKNGDKYIAPEDEEAELRKEFGL